MGTRELAELRLKYEEMLRLRLLHGSADEPDPRRAMAALAGRFPGALREIDELPLDTIKARIEALRAAEANPLQALLWMRASHRFHALTRGALCAKRWLSRSGTVDGHAFALALPTLCYPDDAALWVGELDKIARPPRGRITDLVYARIAIELGVDDAEVRMLVFGPSRAARAGVSSSTKPAD